MNEDFLGAYAAISLCSRISRLKAEAEGKLFFAMRLTLTAKSANKVENPTPSAEKGVGFRQGYGTARETLNKASRSAGI